jgi:hypothetical protein
MAIFHSKLLNYQRVNATNDLVKVRIKIAGLHGLRLFGLNLLLVSLLVAG